MPEIRIRDKEYIISDGITVIGRGQDADIVIDSKNLSRLHVRFTVSGDTIEIEDLGSKNGTFVNNEKVQAKRQLAKGDRLRFADVE